LGFSRCHSQPWQGSCHIKLCSKELSRLFAAIRLLSQLLLHFLKFSAADTAEFAQGVLTLVRPGLNLLRSKVGLR
jgi:hypothetical protein